MCLCLPDKAPKHSVILPIALRCKTYICPLYKVEWELIWSNWSPVDQLVVKIIDQTHVKCKVICICNVNFIFKLFEVEDLIILWLTLDLYIDSDCGSSVALTLAATRFKTVKTFPNVVNKSGLIWEFDCCHFCVPEHHNVLPKHTFIQLVFNKLSLV